MSTVPTPRSYVGELSARPNFRVVIAMMFIALVLSTLFSLRREDVDLPIANLAAIPGDRGDWKCDREIPLPPDLMNEMKADSYVDRRYVNLRLGQEVEIMAVFRRYGRREFAHRPDQCYPAAGYNMTSKDHVTLPYAGREVDAIHLVADGKGVQNGDGSVGAPNETLTYFFASADKTESDFMRQQLLMSIERLIPNKNGWTFIRLSSRHTRGSGDTEALAAQKDFMRVYGPDIQQVITTDTSSAGVATAQLSPSQTSGASH